MNYKAKGREVMFRRLRTRLVPVLFLSLGLFLDSPTRSQEASSLEPAIAGRLELAAGEEAHPIVTIDHAVPHVSTVPANAGQAVSLFVRERVRRDFVDQESPLFGRAQKAVLMIHPLSVPALPGFELRTDRYHDHYDWALSLAQAGLDVFMLDFQGSGLSPLPDRDIAVMKDPCNVNPAQQGFLIPNPLAATCEPSYQSQLINSQSDWSELDRVVDYIRALWADRLGVDVDNVRKVALVSWSQGSFRIGPYAIQHPGKVDSVLFFAPIFNPNGRRSKLGTRFDSPAALPVNEPAGQFGFPMNLTTKAALRKLWDVELQCEGQREERIVDVVWSSIMDNDPLGRAWGPILPDGSPEGVMRVRNPFLWGWNNTTVQFDGTLGGSVPVLIIFGEHDRQVSTAPFSATALYDAIPGARKLMLKVACAGHLMNWEKQRRVLHGISKQWLKDGAVEGYTNGRFLVDTEGNICSIDAEDICSQ